MTLTTTQKTIDAYNKNAEKYASKFDNYETYIKKIKDFHHKFIKNGDSILDLGCGPGNNIRTILEEKPDCEFTGVDLSEEILNIAKRRFQKYNFILQDLRELNIDSQYKIIIASFCIVHLTNNETEELIKKISQLTTKDGYLYLSYMNGNSSGFESTSFSEEEIFFNYYQDDFLENLLRQNNFKILEKSKEEYVETDGSITTDTFIYSKSIK